MPINNSNLIIYFDFNSDLFEFSSIEINFTEVPERCKLHDLGAWANESFRLASPEDPGLDAGSAS